MLIDMTELAICAHKIEMIGSVLVFDYTVAIKAIRLIRYMLVMHQRLVTCSCQECLAPVMACKASIRDHISGINLSLTFHHLKMTTLTGHARFLNGLMGNRSLGFTLIAYL